jgi:phosphohistidine phosphatase
LVGSWLVKLNEYCAALVEVGHACTNTCNCEATTSQLSWAPFCPNSRKVLPRTILVSDMASTAGSPAQRFDAVQEVDIDSTGTFKYILIKISETGSTRSKFSVRGYTFAEYHADIYQKAKLEVASDGVECEVAGGGRIKHQPPSAGSTGSILVYGYSIAYGKADHEISVECLKRTFPNYSISFSDEGY